MQLIDFVLNLVNNKRKVPYSASEIIFPHSKVLQFIELHKTYLKPAQVIKVLIMKRQFRLSLYFMITNDVAFEIEFLKMAIEVNNWEVAFFFMSRYETEVMKQAHQAIKTIVSCFQKTPKYLKAKLFLTRKLLHLFNFEGYKILMHNLK